MKLTATIKRLFKKEKKELSIPEILDKADNTVLIEKHGNREFICYFSVVDINNNFKTVKDGFKTKAEAKAFALERSNMYINSYWEENK